jgi:cysteine-rich repeat protein
MIRVLRGTARVALTCALLVGCARDSLVRCAGELCALDSQCYMDIECVTNAQLSACASVADGQECDAVPNGHCASGVCRSTICGDGIVEFGEACDDGNNVSGDGCAADCQGRFAKMATPTAVDLDAVWTSGPTDAWAVGKDGTILRFDGMAWAKVDFPGADFTAVSGRGPGDVFIIGVTNHVCSGLPCTILVHCVGGVCGEIAGQPLPFQATAVWGTSTDVFVGGEDSVGGVVSPRMCDLQSDVQGCVATSVSTCGATGIVAAGLWASDASNAFAAIGDALCERESGLWMYAGSLGPVITGDATSQTLFGLLQPNVLEMRPMVESMPVPNATIPVPGAVAAVAATGISDLDGFVTAGHEELLAVGDGGVVLDLDVTTQTWTHLVVPTDLPLHAISATDPKNVFIVGTSGTVLH